MPDFAVGPPRHSRTSGAVLAAYVDSGALDRQCPRVKGCGAKVGEFCTFPDGQQRHLPCVVRLAEHREAQK